MLAFRGSPEPVVSMNWRTSRPWASLTTTPVGAGPVAGFGQVTASARHPASSAPVGVETWTFGCTGFRASTSSVLTWATA